MTIVASVSKTVACLNDVHKYTRPVLCAWYTKGMSKRKRWLVVSLTIVVAAIAAYLLYPQANHTDRQQPPADTNATNPQTPQPAKFDTSRYSLESPTSPWVIANKRRPLSPKDFAPQLATPAVPLRLAGSNPEMQVSSQIVPAVEQLFAAAKAAGFDLLLASGFRSYQQQVAVYNAEVRRHGQGQADRQSARPGHSEHQTGLGIDVGPASRQCEIQECFGEMAEGKWVAANAHRYGFILRYLPGNEAITGYTYEPWHLRYVGPELAAEIHEQGNPPLESFFKLGPAADYQ